MKKFRTPSRTSPRGSRRGCLCADRDEYSVECFEGDIDKSRNRQHNQNNIIKNTNIN